MDDHPRKRRTRETSSRRHHHQTVPIEENSGHRIYHGRHEAIQEPVHRISSELQDPLSGQKDYVQRWLAQTVDNLPANPSNQHSNTGKSDLVTD